MLLYYKILTKNGGWKFENLDRILDHNTDFS